MERVLIAASILSADFARLGEEVAAADRAGSDWIHLDVMDGHFVPNLTFGPPVIGAVRRFSRKRFDAHLMVERPDDLLAEYAAAGADQITVHVETCPHLHRTLQHIRSVGARAGVALNPATPLAMLEEVAGLVDVVLLMSVNPGFGGQEFIPGSVERIRRCRELLDRTGSRAELSVDGGVSTENARAIVEAGATVLVAGSALFRHPCGLEAGVRSLRAAALGETPSAEMAAGAAT